MSDITDSMHINVVTHDQSSSVLNGIGNQFHTLSSTIDVSSTHSESLWSKMAAGAGGFLAANVVSQVAGQFTSQIGDIVGKAADFEQKMSAIKATAGATAPELESLKQTALQLGMATDVGSVSAADAANAIFELGKAGVSVADINTGVAKATLQLAAAAGPEFGVANSATLAADAMNTFGLAGKDVTGIVNTLVGAANASTSDLSGLKFALAAVGPVAHQVGMSVGDFSTAIAEMSMHGLKGSDAGTSLKTMLLNLSPASAKAEGQMRELGLITAEGTNLFYDQSGKVKDLAALQQVLQVHLQGLNQEQQAMALKTMFGTDAIRAAAIMTGEGSRGAFAMADAIKKQGDAAMVAATMNDNFKGKLEALGGTIDTIKIAVGSALLPALSEVATGFNQLAGDVMTAFNTGTWAPVLADITTGITGIGTTITDFITGPGLAGILTTLQGWGQAFLLWLVPVLAALPGQFAAYEATMFSWIVGVIPQVQAYLFTLEQQFLDWIVPAIPGIILQLQEWGTGLLTWILDTAIPGVWTLLTTLGAQFVAFIGPNIGPMLTALGELGVGLWTWITGTALPLVVDKLTAWGAAFVEWVGPRIPLLLAEANRLGTALWTWLTGTALPTITTKLGEWGQAFIAWVGPQIPPLLGHLALLLGEVLKWIATQALPAIVIGVEHWMQAIIQWAVDATPKLIWNLGLMLVAIKDWVFGEGLLKLSEWFGQVGGSIIDGILKGLGTNADQVIKFIVDLASKAVDAIKAFFGIHSASTLLTEIFLNVGGGMVQGLVLSGPDVLTAVGTLMGTIHGGITQALDQTQALIQGHGVRQEWAALIGGMAADTEAAVGRMQGALSQISGGLGGRGSAGNLNALLAYESRLLGVGRG